MKISRVYFSQATPLLGRRMVDLSELDGLQNQIQGFVKSTETVRDSTLVNLAGPMEGDLVNFIRLARAKGRSLCRIVEVGNLADFPDWLIALDVVLIRFLQPASLKNPELFNRAIQDLWFTRHEILVSCRVRDRSDVSVVELLYSYTPNDVPFFIELAPGDPGRLLDTFREDRFATARIVVPRDSEPL
jgi:hypothetical protein